jgi:hypothetical protein
MRIEALKVRQKIDGMRVAVFDVIPQIDGNRLSLYIRIIKPRHDGAIWDGVSLDVVRIAAAGVARDPADTGALAATKG